MLTVCRVFPAYGRPRDDDVALAPILVTTRRAHTTRAEATEDILLVEEETIDAHAAHDAGETLRYAGGVAVQEQRGFGRASSLSIQGSDSRQVRFMIDGIPFNTQSSGQVNPSQFPVENIKQVEVLKGASSSLWGSGLGGVVNVVTKDPLRSKIPRASFEHTVAEFRTYRRTGELSGTAGDLGYYSLFSFDESRGRGEHDDTRGRRFFNKCTYALGGAGKLETEFGYNSADVNSGIFPDGAWLSQPYKTGYGKLAWESAPADTRFKAEMKHSRQDAQMRLFGLPESSDPLFEVASFDALYQISLTASRRFSEAGAVTVGSDFDYDVLKSSVYISKAQDLRAQAPFIGYTRRFGILAVNTGIRLDHNSEFGSQVSPSAGAVLRLGGAGDAIARVYAGRSFNAPPLLWKYNDNPALGIAPNPDIKAERAWTLQSGVEASVTPRVRAGLGGYFSDVNDALSSAENDAGSVFMKNFRKFRRSGAEASLTIGLHPDVAFRAGTGFNDIRDASSGKVAQGGGRPRQSFDAGLTYKNTRGFSWTMQGYYRYWNAPASNQPNDRKMLVDTKIAQEFKHVTVFVAVHNVGDSAYWEDFFFPYPRRYCEGGMRIAW